MGGKCFIRISEANGSSCTVGEALECDTFFRFSDNIPCGNQDSGNPSVDKENFFKKSQSYLKMFLWLTNKQGM